jgi:TetR/AcrR family transcriptional regulator, mexJK operon transcriptional repressor
MSQIGETRGRPKDAGKREAILLAARDLFLAAGYGGVSMDNIAAGAGVSKATLYSHFADKDALYRAIVENKVQDYRLSDFSDRLTDDIEADLQLIGESLQDLIYDEEAVIMLRMVIAEARQRSPLVELFDAAGPKKVFQRIVDYLASQKQKHHSWIGEPEDDAELFTGLITGHRRLIQVLMGVRDVPDATERQAIARHAVASYLKLRRD